MVRNYVRKTDRASKYTRDDLLEAIGKVKSGELSAYRASTAYNIPRSTIVARVYGRYGEKSDSLGRCTVIPMGIERSLVENLHQMEIYGFGLSRTEVMELVGHYVTKNNIPNPFKNGIPGEDWFVAFKKRHSLAVKKPQAVENSRKKACNPWIIYSYYDLLKKNLDELELHDKPSQIWNLDETSFCKDPSKTKVVGLKGYASTRTIASPGKSNTTVLLCINAAGDKTPPLIVYKGKDVWDRWVTEDDYPGTRYAATKNGWMETDVFERFFEKVFLPTVGQKRPQLLVYDGHSTHVGLNIIEKAREADITILKLPAHTSDNLQPLDLAVNKSFKDKWDQALVKWQRLHVGEVLSKKDFSKLIGEIWAQVDPKVCVAGFRKAGIFPFNSNAVPEEKFHPDQLAEYKKQLCQSNESRTQDQSTQPTPGPSWAKDFSKNETEIPTVSNTSSGVPSPFPSLVSIILDDHNKKWLSVKDKHLSDAKIDETTQSVDFNDNNQSTQPTPGPSWAKDSSKNLTEISPLTNTSTGVPSPFPSLDSICRKKVDDYNKQWLSVNDKHLSDAKTAETTQSVDFNANKKITVIDDRLVKCKYTFEELLLQKIRSGSPHNNKQKRTKVACGAEVITSEEIFKKQKLAEEEKRKKNREKEERMKRKLEKTLKKDVNIKTSKEKNKAIKNTIAEGDRKKTENFKILEKNKSRKTNKKNVRNVKRQTSTNSKKRKLDYSSTSESDADLELMDESDLENLEDMLDDEQKDLVENYEDMLHNEENDQNVDLQTETNNLDDYDDPPTSTVVTGQWILVKFTTKSSLKHYVGIVSSVNHEGIPTVKYVRKSAIKGSEDNTAFIYPNVPDVCELRHLDDIVCKLPNPIIGRRGKIFFKMSFEGYNII